jgi:hypothetical protein
MFTLTFKTDNEAFSPDAITEVVRILRDVANRVEQGRTVGPCMDANGNRVGSYTVLPD